MENCCASPFDEYYIVIPNHGYISRLTRYDSQQKTREYISIEFKQFINKVDPNNVILVCTNNAPNMLGATNDILWTYLHIYKQGLTVQAFNLLLED